jgi:adenine phosphoribosyltransferase
VTTIARPEELLVNDPEVDLKSFIRDVPDFPKPGILFKDIMPLLQDPIALRYTVDRLVEFGTGKRVDLVLGAEARGFILGAAMAYGLGAGFIPARKPGKLPWNVTRAEYELEYGTDALEMHADAVRPGQRVIIHDDLLATGGTALAKIELVERAGGVVVGLAFVVELEFLKGRDRLAGRDICSLIAY